MVFLGKKEIVHRIKNEKLVEGFDGLDFHPSANGIDVHLAALIEVKEGGKLAVQKANNVLPKLGTAYVLKGHEDKISSLTTESTQILEKESSIKIKAHQPYLLIIAEKVNIPTDHLCIAKARTSLHRFTQSHLIAVFGEAGYRGTLTFMLVPMLDAEVELGARIAQLAFSKISSHSHYEDQKEHSFQDGKIL